MISDARLEELSDRLVRMFERNWTFISAFIDANAGEHLTKQDTVRVAFRAMEKMMRFYL